MVFWKLLKLKRILGFMISHDLKTSIQSLAYANANKILGMINRTIVNKHSDF